MTRETCEIAARFAGLFFWTFVATTPSGDQIGQSSAFFSALITPNQGRASQRALDRLVAQLSGDGWQVVRRNDDAPKRARGNWWATYLVRSTSAAIPAALI